MAPYATIVCVHRQHNIIIGIKLAQTLPIIVAKYFAGGNDIVSAKGKI